MSTRGRSLHPRPVWTACLAALVLAQSGAQAHLVNSGFGGFYDGVAHFFISPYDLLLVLGLCLLAGNSGAPAARNLIVALPAAWLAGSAGAHWLQLPPPPAWSISLSFGVTGLLVALGWRPGPRPSWMLGAGFGLLHGWENGASMQATSGATLTMIGIAAAIFMVCSLLSAAITTFRAAWLHIAVRIAGSWIAAISMLMIAWYVRTTGIGTG